MLVVGSDKDDRRRVRQGMDSAKAIQVRHLYVQQDEIGGVGLQF